MNPKFYVTDRSGRDNRIAGVAPSRSRVEPTPRLGRGSGVLLRCLGALSICVLGCAGDARIPEGTSANGLALDTPILRKEDGLSDTRSPNVPWVSSPPKVSFQAQGCAKYGSSLDSMVSTIKGKLTAMDPAMSVDVRSSCDTAAGLSGILRVGVWTTKANSVDTDAARDASLGEIELLEAGEMVALNIKKSIFDELIYDLVMSKSVGGGITLTGREVDITQTDEKAFRLQVALFGEWDDGILPGPIPFSASIHADSSVKDFETNPHGVKLDPSDSSIANYGYRGIVSEVSDIKLDAGSFLNKIVDIFSSTTIPVDLPPVFDNPTDCTGPVPNFVFIPQSFPIGDGKKLVLDVMRFEGSNGKGISIGATILGATFDLYRTPYFGIVGPSSISAEPDLGGLSASAAYSVCADDAVLPVTHIAWSSQDSDAGSGDPFGTAWSSYVTWTVPSIIGLSTHRTLQVAGKDAEGVPVAGHKMVTLVKTLDGLDPVCDEKPYLDQCNP